MFVVSRYWTTTGNGQTVTEVPRDNKAAIMDSIASSYALQRPRFGATTPPKPAKSDGKSGGWPYYQRYKQAEAQKAQIFEDIQRKMANATSGNSIGGVHSWNSTDIAGQRQHRLRMKHHRLTSKGKRLRTRKWGGGNLCDIRVHISPLYRPGKPHFFRSLKSAVTLFTRTMKDQQLMRSFHSWKLMVKQNSAEIFFHANDQRMCPPLLASPTCFLHSEETGFC